MIPMLNMIPMLDILLTEALHLITIPTLDILLLTRHTEAIIHLHQAMGGLTTHLLATLLTLTKEKGTRSSNPQPVKMMAMDFLLLLNILQLMLKEGKGRRTIFRQLCILETKTTTLMWMMRIEARNNRVS
jgi:hypothetical protein